MKLGYSVSLWPRVCTAKHAMETGQFSKPPEVQAAGIIWQDKVHCFLECWTCRLLVILCLTKWQLLNFITLTYFTKCMSHASKEKRREKLTHVPLLLHDNAPSHGTHIGQAAILNPDLKKWVIHHILLTWHLFPKLKNHLKYATKEWVKGAVRTFLFYRHPKTPRSL